MKSLLFRDDSPFTEAPTCQPCRTEVVQAVRKNGRIYRFVLRDKVVVYDQYLLMVKAAAFAIQTGEPYAATPPQRKVRDFLIKQTVTI